MADLLEEDKLNSKLLLSFSLRLYFCSGFIKQTVWVNGDHMHMTKQSIDKSEVTIKVKQCERFKKPANL